MIGKPPFGPRRARKLAAAVAATDEDLAGHVDDVELVASELVANAHLHGREPVTLEVTATADQLRLDVQDQGLTPPAPLPPLETASDEGGVVGAEHGRGLRMVHAIADESGIEHHPTHGTRAWAVWRRRNVAHPQPGPAQGIGVERRAAAHEAGDRAGHQDGDEAGCRHAAR